MAKECNLHSFPITSAVGRYSLKLTAHHSTSTGHSYTLDLPSNVLLFEITVCAFVCLVCLFHVWKQQHAGRQLEISKGVGYSSSFTKSEGPKSPTKATGHGTCFIHICNLVVPLESSKIFKSGRKFGQKLGVFWQNFGQKT